MSFRPSRLFSLSLILGLGMPASATADGPADPAPDELIRQGRSATALVDFTPSSKGFAAALCVHPSGLFVTVVEPLVSPGVRLEKVRVVIRPGLPDQSVHDAEVLCRVKDPGLTLLRVKGAKRLKTLPWAPAEQIDELMDVTAFEVDVHREPAGEAHGEFPAIRSGTGSISALQRHGEGLSHIQFEAPKTNGGSGGPLLDAKGRVLGVILGRAQAGAGQGVGLAVPINSLDDFLNHAEVTFTPPVVTAKNLRRPTLFQAQARTFFPAKAPLEVSLKLEDPSGGEARRIPMSLKGNVYQAATEPLAVMPAPPTVRLEVMFDDGAVSATVPDQALSIAGARSFRLGELRLLRLRPKAVALLGNGVRVEGPEVAELAETNAVVGGQTLPLDLGRAEMIAVQPPDAYPAVACTVVASRSGREVGRSEARIYPEDRVSPCLEALRDGRFIRPARGKAPTTYLTFQSVVKSPAPGPSLALGPGDFRVILAENGNYVSIDPNAGRVIGVRRTNPYRGILIETAPRNTPGRWEFLFESPQGRDLAPGDYPHARGMDVTGEFPELRFEYPDRLPGYEWANNQNRGNTGRFLIWELELKDGRIERLALDFSARCEWHEATLISKPFYGMIRYNSSFQ